jgi:hypothetical protein
LSVLRFRCPERGLNTAQVAPLLIKSADDDSGTVTGLASVFDNLDHDGDIVPSRGLQQVTRTRHTPILLVWMHKADDPRCYVNDVVEARETDDGSGYHGPV